jgi:predicted nucleotidyltransferase
LVLLYDATNPRVFGSVARGEGSEASDLDLLVDPIDGRTTL